MTGEGLWDDPSEVLRLGGAEDCSRRVERFNKALKAGAIARDAMEGQIDYETATKEIGVLPDIPAVPQTVSALDSTLALVEGGSDFV